MPTKLKLAEQRRLYQALPQTRKNALRKHCQTCQMRGDGIKDIFKTIGRVLGPIAKEIGPTVMKEIVLPMLKKKIEGKGKGRSPLSTPGNGKGNGLSPAGGSLKLAGQGKKKRRRRKTKGGSMSTIYTN